MPTTSSLRLFRAVDKLDPPEQAYWQGWINKREHLKREYPQGIPMRILFPTGLFSIRELHGAYCIGPDGRAWITSAGIEGCQIPGPREVPLPWYLLFAWTGDYVASLDEALASLERSGHLIRSILEHERFDLVREESCIYLLQHTLPSHIASLAAYLASEDDTGYIELAYGDTGLSCDPLISARILEDRRRHIFPRQIASALEYIAAGQHGPAEELLEEVCLIHRYLSSVHARESIAVEA
ncbi:MAG TPA: hypothetical protein PK297_03100 [Spirochaetota bacterium]|nr:hypothetical protein [Spirochaetota bacterium]